MEYNFVIFLKKKIKIQYIFYFIKMPYKIQNVKYIILRYHIPFKIIS